MEGARPTPVWLLPELTAAGAIAATTRARFLLPEPAMVFRHKPDEEGVCKPCRRMFAVLKPDKHRCKFLDEKCNYCHHPAHFLTDAPPTMRGTKPQQKTDRRRMRERELKRERKRQQMIETGDKADSASEDDASEDSKTGGTAEKPGDLWPV